VTVTISGLDGINAYGEALDLFSSEILPAPVMSIYMTNITAYAGVFKQNPSDNFTLLLDFGKPPVFDWSSIVSNPTTNNSKLSISGLDLTFVRSVEASIANTLQHERPFWKFIHAPFVYDIGLWFIGMPYAIYFLSGIINWITIKVPRLEEFKFALYIYTFVIFSLTLSILISIHKMGFSFECLRRERRQLDCAPRNNFYNYSWAYRQCNIRLSQVKDRKSTFAEEGTCPSPSTASKTATP